MFFWAKISLFCICKKKKVEQGKKNRFQALNVFFFFFWLYGNICRPYYCCVIFTAIHCYVGFLSAFLGVDVIRCRADEGGARSREPKRHRDRGPQVRNPQADENQPFYRNVSLNVHTSYKTSSASFTLRLVFVQAASYKKNTQNKKFYSHYMRFAYPKSFADWVT